MAALLAISVVSTIYLWASRSEQKPLRVVHGVVSPDLAGYFADPEVRSVFAERGLDVQVQSKRNPSAAATRERSKLDFAFGAAISDGPPLPKPRHGTTSYLPFTTPMAVATSSDVANVLQRAGVAQQRGNHWTLDMGTFIDLVVRHTSWNDLAEGMTHPAARVALTTSTDVTTNSAMMYASIASYAANHGQVLTSPANVDEVVNRVIPLFAAQGHAARSVVSLFADSFSRGAIPNTRMLMITEAQFVARSAVRDRGMRPDVVLLYPDPDAVSRYTLVPLAARGVAVGRLLSDDPALQRLAVRHGFRTPANPRTFSSFVSGEKIAVEPSAIDAIDLPTSNVLHALMTRIDAALHVTLGPRSGSAASNTLLSIASPMSGPTQAGYE